MCRDALGDGEAVLSGRHKGAGQKGAPDVGDLATLARHRTRAPGHGCGHQHAAPLPASDRGGAGDGVRGLGGDIRRSNGLDVSTNGDALERAFAEVALEKAGWTGLGDRRPGACWPDSSLEGADRSAAGMASTSGSNWISGWVMLREHQRPTALPGGAAAGRAETTALWSSKRPAGRIGAPKSPVTAGETNSIAAGNRKLLKYDLVSLP